MRDKVKRIWIVTELFYPEETSTAYILTKIANKLTEKYEVHVISSAGAYDREKSVAKSLQEINKSIIITRVSGINLDKDKIVSRVTRLIVIAVQLSWRFWLSVGRDDRVLIVTNPAPLLLLISFLRKFRQFHLSILVHDVFPENTISVKLFSSTNKFGYKVLKYLFDKAYSKASVLIVLGRDMSSVMKGKLKQFSKQPIIEIIENWAELDMISPNTNNGYRVENKVVVQYAGNWGRLQGLMALLEIIKKSHNNDVLFSFWGNGAMREEVTSFVKENNLTNVLLHGCYTRKEQSGILNSCDLAIVSLAQGMYGLGVPSKSYNIMAAGKPILFIGDLNSEIALMVKEYDLGYVFDPMDVDGLIAFIERLSIDFLEKLRLKGDAARMIAEQYYSEEIIINKFITVL